MSGTDYTHLALPAALQAKWDRGQKKYGKEFVGNPLVELDCELLDALNYADEAARRGIKLPGVRVMLEAVRKQVLAAHSNGNSPVNSSVQARSADGTG